MHFFLKGKRLPFIKAHNQSENQTKQEEILRNLENFSTV